MQVLERYRDRFSTDYSENKKILGQVAIIRSKTLKNEMAGFITKYMKKEQNSREEKQAGTQQVPEQPESQAVQQEIVIENTPEESS